MPQVPDIPGVSVLPERERASQVRAPRVDPDLSHRRLVQDTLNRGQRVAINLREKELAAEEEAATTAAEFVSSQYYIRSREVLVGKDGALTKRETAVTSPQGDDGKSFTDHYLGVTDEIGRELLSTIRDNPRAMELAIKRMDGMRKGFANELYNHEGAQWQAMRVRGAATQSAVAASRLADGEDPFGLVREIQAANVRAARLQGRNPNDPREAYVIRQATEKQVGSAAMQFLKACILNNSTPVAKRFVGLLNDTGYLSGDDLSSLQSIIDADELEHSLNDAATAAESFLAGRRTTSGLLADALGGNLPDGMLERYAEQSGVNPAIYRAMPENVREEETRKITDSLIRDYGSADGARLALSFESNARLEEATKAAKEKYGDNYTAASLTEFMNPEELERARTLKKKMDAASDATQTPKLYDYAATIKLQNPQMTDDQVQAAATRAFAKGEEQRKYREAVAATAANQIYRMIESAAPGQQINVSAVDMSSFTAEQRVAANEMIRNHYQGTEGTDTTLAANLSSDPARLSRMSDADWILMIGQIPREDWMRLNARRDELLDRGVPSGSVKDSLVNAAFEDAIVHNPAFANWDALDDDERKAKARVLKNILWQELSRIQIQTGTAKGPMTEEEAVKFGRAIMNRFWKQTPWYGGTNLVTVADMRGSDIPDPVMYAIARNEGFTYNAGFSNLQKVGYALEYINDPRKALSTAWIPLRDVDEIRREWKRATGREPDDALLSRVWILRKCGQEKLVRGLMGLDPIQTEPLPNTPSYERFSRMNLQDAALSGMYSDNQWE